MKLYVGNIPHSFSEEDLKDIFKDYNVKSVKLILDRETNRSRGFGFVEFESKEEGEKAISELNDKEFEGRKLVVNEAKPKRDNFRRSNFRSRY